MNNSTSICAECRMGGGAHKVSCSHAPITSNQMLSDAELVFQLAQLEAALDIRIGDIPSAQIVRAAIRRIEGLSRALSQQDHDCGEDTCVCG